MRHFRRFPFPTLETLMNKEKFMSTSTIPVKMENGENQSLVIEENFNDKSLLIKVKDEQGNETNLVLVQPNKDPHYQNRYQILVWNNPIHEFNIRPRFNKD